ncbi:hypothetical protein ElyMa_001057800 [Elysia marginata]|uniref:VWFA domain-containing protein n=1 Tax=Elysia marginata TaxID=1093978 RepID=A0AAV4HT57_9GAST|nr:hypothetical protein ElyMa_001057800 [Elysia marginata]
MHKFVYILTDGPFDYGDLGGSDVHHLVRSIGEEYKPQYQQGVIGTVVNLLLYKLMIKHPYWDPQLKKSTGAMTKMKTSTIASAPNP